MNISIIAAMTDDRLIGLDNTLPWRLPADLKHFKQLTIGKPIIMGRKTFDSIGRPLPDRKNIIISRNQDLIIPDCDTVTSIDAAVELAGDVSEIMIIGGAQIYAHALPKTTRMYLTLVHVKIDGDTYFPEWNQDEWSVVSKETYQADELNQYDYSFVEMAKNASI